VACEARRASLQVTVSATVRRCERFSARRAAAVRRTVTDAVPARSRMALPVATVARLRPIVPRPRTVTAAASLTATLSTTLPVRAQLRRAAAVMALTLNVVAACPCGRPPSSNVVIEPIAVGAGGACCGPRQASPLHGGAGAGGSGKPPPTRAS
jgi:hypothetical protein